MDSDISANLELQNLAPEFSALGYELGHAIERLVSHCRRYQVDAVAAAEARGFLLAAPLALDMKLPLIPLRKPGKLPFNSICHSYELEYGTAELHMHVDSVKPGARVLLVDDVLATGGTMEAGCRLVEKAGGRVAACVFLLELGFLRGSDRLKPHECFSLIRYD